MARLMRCTALALVLLCARAAAAQPGPTPPRFHLLSDEDRELLARGEITDGQVVAGGLVGSVFGFGLGHAIQGRFKEKGWIFLAGGVLATGMIAKYIVDCTHDNGARDCEEHRGWLAGGLLIGIGVRFWEVIDVWFGPSVHNGRVRVARWRAGLPAGGFHLAPAPGGATAGLTLRF